MSESTLLAQAYEAELRLGLDAVARQDLQLAFERFERAHILGQRHTWRHVRAHLAMLRIGWRRRDFREVRGQLSRILAAAVFSRIWVPEGNTGGANVSAFERMPIPEDLRRILGQ